jgi:hypothetical protein
MKKIFHFLGVLFIIFTSCLGKDKPDNHSHDHHSTSLEHKQTKIKKYIEKIKKYEVIMDKFMAQQQKKKNKIENLLNQLNKTNDEKNKALLVVSLEKNYKIFNKILKKYNVFALKKQKKLNKINQIQQRIQQLSQTDQNNIPFGQLLNNSKNDGSSMDKASKGIDASKMPSTEEKTVAVTKAKEDGAKKVPEIKGNQDSEKKNTTMMKGKK